jgi:hypothetical protein
MTFKAGVFLSAVLAAAPVSVALAGGDEVFGGAEVYPFAIVSHYDLAKDAFASSTALYVALNGDLAREGFAVRLAGTMDSYSYDAPWHPAWDVDGDAWSIDGMLGFRWLRGDIASGIFVGAEHQDHDLSPNDPLNPVRGSETGFKVLLDIRKAATPYSPVYADLTASYSTAFETYQVDGRIGLAYGRVVIGPEAWFLGDESGDAQRVGAFLLTDLPPLLFSNVSSELTISAGYQFTDDDVHGSTFGSEGAYGVARFKTHFNLNWR